ncbi:MAG: hypothetical protein M1434_07110 [Chloroflexi bacterium]|nr:hypothetical protein [Chloroflexota bacterium]MCL5274500.1 hypothetical protein [Chloroflexota bacterium]
MALTETATARPARPATAAMQAPTSTLGDLSWWITGVLAMVLVMLAVTVAALIRAATGDLTMAWFISRGAGISAYLLITGSMIYGLMITTRTATGAVPAPVTFSMHEFISLIGLALGLAHAVVLMWDGYIKYTPGVILLPFTSAYRTTWVGIGQIAFYMSLLVTVTFYARKHIGQRAWRSVHYLSFLAFILLTLHGIYSGTDSKVPAMQIVYIASGGAVLFLTLVRVLTRKRAHPAKAAPKPAARAQ